MLVPEFPAAEIAGAAERDRTDMTENLPLPLRCLYGEGRTSAVNQFAADKTALDKIECQCLEKSDFGHLFPANRKTAAYAR